MGGGNCRAGVVGMAPCPLLSMLCPTMLCRSISRACGAGTVRAFFKGNGTNVVKIAPETAIKLTLNDALKRVGGVLGGRVGGSAPESHQADAQRCSEVVGWMRRVGGLVWQPSKQSRVGQRPHMPTLTKHSLLLLFLRPSVFALRAHFARTPTGCPWLQVVQPNPDEDITPGQRMTAGAAAGAIAQMTIYPFELVGVVGC